MKKLHVHFAFTLLTLGILLLGVNWTSLFDWDELNFAESAREMNLTQNYLYVQIGYEPFWEKPPFFIWMQALAERLFQSHDPWVYKFPNILAGVIAVNWVYHVGDRLGKKMLGAFWAVATLFSFAPFIYWRSGIIDPVFNLFIVLSIYQWYKITQANLREERSHLYYLLVGVFLGFAFLTKGPVALGIVGFVIIWVSAARGKWHEIFNWKILLSLFGLSAVIGLWVYPLLQSNGAQFLEEFIAYQLVLFQGQIVWHNQPWFYHIVVLFFLAFPVSILALPHLFKNQIMDRNVEVWSLFMRALFWVVLIIFSITTTKIIHYSSLCWWPLTYFGAYQVYLIHTNRWHFPKWLILPLSLSALGMGIALWILPVAALADPLPDWLWTKLDVFTKGLLSVKEPWSWTSLLPAALFTFWFFAWFILQILGRKPHAGMLFIISGVVALSSSIWLLPPVAKLLQGPLTKTIQQETQKGVFLEAWYFKTYALYFHGNFSSKDFDQLRPEFPTAKNEPYPQQSARRSHAMNASNQELTKVITKNNFDADYEFNRKFVLEKNIGGYLLWRKRPVQP